MKERTVSYGSSYRYGFNNQEKDAEMGEYYSFEFRIEDSRIGKFLSIDKLTIKHPDLSPFSFTANSPLIFRENDGRDFYLILFDPKNATHVNMFNSFKNNLLAGVAGEMGQSYSDLIEINYTNSITKIKNSENIEQDCYEVTMTINEDKLIALAKNQAGPEATPQQIEDKKCEIRTKIEKAQSYKVTKAPFEKNGLNLIIGLVESSGGKYGFKLATGHLYESLAMDDINDMSSFSKSIACAMIIHELTEELTLVENFNKSDDKSSNNHANFCQDPNQLGPAHAAGLKAQAQILGFDDAVNHFEQFETPTNGEMYVFFFKKNSDNTYNVTILKFKMINNQFVKLNNTTTAMTNVVNNVSEADYKAILAKPDEHLHLIIKKKETTPAAR